MIYTHNDEKSLKSVGQRVTDHLAEAGFSLREYCSNNASILSHFDNCASVSNSVKVLGYVYSPEKDKMYIKSSKYDASCTTKRKIVSAISSIYDPIGIINPTLVQAKLFLRKLCEEKYTWDEKFNSADLCNIAINRSVACDVEPCSLIIFADASKSAYGFVSYVLQGNKSDILTKPISITKFCANVGTWLTGPNWINLPKKQWPHGRLGCLPAPFNECSTEVGGAESAPIILPVTELLDPMADPVIKVHNYSSCSKLLAVTSKVFEAISKMKKENASPSEIKLRTFD